MLLLNYLSPMIKVVILGGGNLAYHLTNIFLENNAVNLVQVYNRDFNKIQYLKGKSLITNNLFDIVEADIYFIVVADKAIAEVTAQLKFKDKLVVHTSGSVALSDLDSHTRKGVFYLLQSFSKEVAVDFSTIPICIEASNEADLKLLKKLALSLSDKCYAFDSNQRKNLHMAAVFVNNFVNHLYAIGNTICGDNNIPFDVLLPLIEETAKKVAKLHPLDAQTGPAKRNDTATIEKHLALLSKNQQEIYTLLSKSIANTHGKKL